MKKKRFSISHLRKKAVRKSLEEIRKLDEHIIDDTIYGGFIEYGGGGDSSSPNGLFGTSNDKPQS